MDTNEAIERIEAKKQSALLDIQQIKMLCHPAPPETYQHRLDDIEAYDLAIQALKKQVPMQTEPTCLWTDHKKDQYCSTECGHNIDYKYTENGWIYCPYCGGRIVSDK
jgi:hypothetical protein